MMIKCWVAGRIAHEIPYRSNRIFKNGIGAAPVNLEFAAIFVVAVGRSAYSVTAVEPDATSGNGRRFLVREIGVLAE